MQALKRFLTVRRLFWFSMVLLHVPALASLAGALLSGVAEGHAPAMIVRLAGLTLSAGFFVLKIADVSCLRFKPGWRTVVATIIVLAIIHLGVIERATGGVLDGFPSHLGVVLFVGTLWSSLHWRRWIAALRNTAAGLIAVPDVPPPCGPHGLGSWMALLRLRPQVAVLRITGPRAPPNC